MSAPVDVLAVMAYAAQTFRDLRAASRGVDHALDVEDADLARAAVAELVATVGVAVTESRLLPEEKQAEWLRSQCRAALAKFGGVP